MHQSDLALYDLNIQKGLQRVVNLFEIDQDDKLFKYSR